MQKREEGQILVSELERKLSFLSDREQYELSRKLAIETEACIYINNNRNIKTKMDIDYKSKFRVILANLRDEKNTELRFKVLTNQITPQALSQFNERVC